jgi:hypothetical protein
MSLDKTILKRFDVMKKVISCVFFAVLLIITIPSAYPQAESITVLNPRGTPPPIPLIPMAPRLESLEGKTIYLVDVKYDGGAEFLKAVMEWFKQNIPSAGLEFREKAGGYHDADPALWAEIKEKADAVILAIGH